MKATIHLVALMLLALGLPAANAQWGPPFSCPVPAIPQAPDACGPGYYSVNAYGQCYGPNYWLVPPGLPFNGMIFARQAQGNPGCAGAGAGIFAGFPTHQFVRSLRAISS